jgi:hypothetical protein
VKLIIWGALIFGLYTGWCWLPAQRMPSHLESGITSILGALNHTSPDSAIRQRTWTAIDSKGLYVAPKDIQVTRSQRPGERVVDVRFEIPVKIDWLGSERTLIRPVHINHSWAVNEGAESQRLAQIEDSKRFEAEQNRIATRHLKDYQSRVKRECAKGNTKHMRTTGVFVTFSDGTHQNVDCSQAAAW